MKREIELFLGFRVLLQVSQKMGTEAAIFQVLPYVPATVLAIPQELRRL